MKDTKNGKNTKKESVGLMLCDKLWSRKQSCFRSYHTRYYKRMSNGTLELIHDETRRI